MWEEIGVDAVNFVMNTAEVVPQEDVLALSDRYDGATGRVALDGGVALLTGHASPRALSPSDLQYTSTMNPARLDRGLRLLQVERDQQFARVDVGSVRGRLRRGDMGRAAAAVVPSGVGLLGRGRCRLQARPLRLPRRRVGVRGTEPPGIGVELAVLHAFIAASS